MKDFHPVLSSQEIAQEEAKPEINEHSWLDLLGAHFKTNITNTLAGFVSEDIKHGIHPEYDFRLEEEDLEGYEEYANAFMDVTNRQQLDAYKTKIDGLRLQHKIIAEHGWLMNQVVGLATMPADALMTAGLSVPIVGIAGTVSTRLMAKAGLNAFIARTVGASAFKGVAGRTLKGAIGHAPIGAGIGALSVASTAALGVDVEMGDVAKGMGYGALLSSICGGLGGAMNKIQRNQVKSATKGFYDSLIVPAEEALPPIYEETFIPISELDKGLIGNTKFIEAEVSKTIPISGLDPTTSLQTSPFPKSKQLASLLTDTFLTFVDKEGVPIISEANVESSTGALYAAAMTKSQRTIKKSFKSYRERLKAEKAELVFGRKEFNEATGRAVRNYGESPIPEVQEAAKFYTEETTKQTDLLMKNDIYGYKSGKISSLEGKIETLTAEMEGFKKPYEKRLETLSKELESRKTALVKSNLRLKEAEAKLKGEDVTKAQRRSHGRKIGEFKERERDLKSTQSKIRVAKGRYEKKLAGRGEKIEVLGKEIETTKAKTYTSKDLKDMGLDEAYLHAVYDKGWISSNELLATDRLTTGFMRHHKLDLTTARTAAISAIDQILGEPVGRMTTNILERGALKERKLLIPSKYLKEAMIDDITIVFDKFMKSTTVDNRLFELFGTLNVDDVIAQIEKEYKTIRKFPGTEKDMNFLRKSYEKDAENVRTIWNRLRGLQGLDSHSLIRKHAAFKSVGNIILNVTAMRAMGGVALTMLQDIGQITCTVGLKRFYGSSFKLLKDPRMFKKIKADPWLNALKLERGTRQTPLAQASAGSNLLSIAERGSSKLSDTFYKSTCIHQIDDFTKFLTAYATSENALKIMKQSLSGKAMNKSDASFMKSMGIGKKWFKPIIEQFEKHGEIEKDIYAPNIDLWTNRDAKLVFGSAIKKIQNQAVLTPGVGTLPKFFDNPFLSVITQFRSFAFSAYQKALIPALEKKDLNVFIGFITMSMMGIFKNWLLCAIDGREFDPERAVSNSLKTNDMLAWLPDMYGVFDSILHIDPEVRHAHASLWDEIGGAGGSTLTEAGIAGGIVGRTLRGEPVSKTQIRAARKLIPWQNHIILRGMFNKIEEATIEKYAKKKSTFK